MSETLKNKKEKYKVELETSNETITKKADTIYDAIESMGLTWDKIKAKGVIRVSEDKKSFEKVFQATELRRIFGSKEARMLWSNNLKYLLG